MVNKLSSGGVLEVSLIENIEEVKPKKVLPSIPEQQVKPKKPMKQEALLQRPPKKEEKKEERREEKQDPAPAVLQEEKIKETEELPPENKFWPISVEQPLPIQAKVKPTTQGNENEETLNVSTGGQGNSMAPGAAGATSKSTFLMFTGSRPEKGVTEGESTKETSFGKGGEGSHLTVSKMHSPSIEVDRILKQIIRKIEAAKRYPKVARKMGIEGKAVVRFKLQPQGQVEAIEIVESSGSEILDRASLQTVRDAAPFPYKEGWLKVGIVFKIL
ncbi:MAG: energy transducer TonB [Thermodesulfobacteriota bacterium]|nr:energy transducer TonB [Thermodesulfobacteriota bacterium]